MHYSPVEPLYESRDHDAYPMQTGPCELRWRQLVRLHGQFQILLFHGLVKKIMTKIKHCLADTDEDDRGEDCHSNEDEDYVQEVAIR